ncbi:hypothetical protein [Mesoterricola silvestris]|uniref:Uncharacterized protein n=1 Tax=Mesoterricola silvestris TaxID=2927979 RepID=A0AA48GQB5_9BACT|nr:hypothetical protein [Mesoterricola silvestris]BDU74159.1 hypothetical protein METEAL_33330 [Mesoterricola silvestris]
MRAHPTLLTALLVLPLLSLGTACRRSAEARTQEATALMRAMDQEVLAAQRTIITQFKALPQADEYRLALDKGLDTWDISDKKLAENEEAMEKALIGFQKDAREDALIGEYRLYAKKMARTAQEQEAEYDSRRINTRKEMERGTFNYQGATIPLGEPGKRIRSAVLAILPLEIHLQAETRRISAEYEAKLSKLLP